MPLSLSALAFFSVGMNSSGLDQLLKEYFAAKFGLSLDFVAIENQMSPDANGDMGVTGSYRKKAGDKNTFFTLTVNLASRKVKNLQEYG
jgi:hypothetical protein